MEQQQKQSQFDQDILQAQQEFADQFNPNSANYHKGSQVAVPLGGKKIPKGMENMFPEENKQQQQQQNIVEINYGKEYDDIMASRTYLMEMKKDLAKVCPILEAIMRHKENFKAKGSEENQSHIETLQKHIETEKTKLTPVMTVLQKYIQHFEQQQDQFIKDKYVADLKKICTDAEKDFKDKEDFADYQFLIKKVSSASFNDAKKLLDQIKKIKKEVDAKLSTEQNSKENNKENNNNIQQQVQAPTNEDIKDTKQQQN